MSVPGAATSGFWRPSRVGPWLLETLTRRRAWSRLATETIRWAQARVLTVALSTNERSEKKDGNAQASRRPILPTGRGSSRSIQA